MAVIMAIVISPLTRFVFAARVASHFNKHIPIVLMLDTEWIPLTQAALLSLCLCSWSGRLDCELGPKSQQQTLRLFFQQLSKAAIPRDFKHSLIEAFQCIVQLQPNTTLHDCTLYLIQYLFLQSSPGSAFGDAFPVVTK